MFTLFLVFFLLRPEKCASRYLVLTFAQGQLPWKETLDVTLPHSGTVWFTFKFLHGRFVACAISRLKNVCCGRQLITVLLSCGHRR
jgi:hypothetical protein